jgi:hypothetical protein
MRFVIKWGIYINIERCGVYSSNPIVSPPVGLYTDSVIQRYGIIFIIPNKFK